jgi:hypothetical protein
MKLYTKPRSGSRAAQQQFPKNLQTFAVRSSTRGGTSTAYYSVESGVARLVMKTEPRGLRRGRAFAWARGGGDV